MSTETAPPLGYDVNHGFRIDGSQVQWWSTKTAARAAAKSIGWPAGHDLRLWPEYRPLRIDQGDE